MRHEPENRITHLDNFSSDGPHGERQSPFAARIPARRGIAKGKTKNLFESAIGTPSEGTRPTRFPAESIVV